LVVVPDLDEDLTAAFGDVEELLLTLRWQEKDDPDGSVQHLPALAGGVALQALRRVADTVRPTQTNPATWTGGRVLGPDGRYVPPFRQGFPCGGPPAADPGAQPCLIATPHRVKKRAGFSVPTRRSGRQLLKLGSSA